MKLMVFILFLIFSFEGFAQTRGQVESLLRRHISAQADVRLIWNSELYQQGEILVPASLAKLFSVHMAIEKWGADQSFQTQIRWAESPSNTSVVRQVELIGDGDPEFDVDSLIDLWISQGVRVIEGDISIGGSIFRVKPKDMNEVNDSGYCYNALSNDLNMNFNCVSVRVTAGGAQILDPDLKASVKVDVQLGSRWNGTRPHFRWKNSEKTKFSYFIKTQLKAANSVAHVDVLVPDTKAWIIAKIKRVGREKGLTFKNQVGGPLGKVRSYSLSSKPVNKVACEAISQSRNVYADSLFRRLGEDARDQFLGQYPGVIMTEGTGLSRRNQIPAQETYALLKDIQDQGLLQDYLNCLPSSGETGTLEKRLQSIPGLIKAKTGSLSGMSHLAGYALNSKNQWVPFVFMYQQRKTRVRDLRKTQDAILQELIQSY